MYEYKVSRVIKVVDGDTVDCAIDLGFGIREVVFRFRLAGVDTPERGEPDYDRATEIHRAWHAQPGLVTVKTQKAGPSTSGIGDGAFGRWLGDFYRGDDSLSARLKAEGW